jgi:HEAT repeat protein
MNRYLILLMPLVLSLASSCAKSPPTLAGGRPVGFWIEALQGPDAQLRKKAAFKLGNVGPADPAAFPALLAALSDRDASVRCEVILALAKFGAEAREAVPALVEVQRRDRDARVRLYAGRAVELLGKL